MTLDIRAVSDRRFDVLDHGFVRLVDSMGDDTSIVRAARVSYAGHEKVGVFTTDADQRLITRLWRDKHTSPFEAVTFTFHVKAPIFVLRQWHRHRTQSYNELSGRYRELTGEFYVPDLNDIGVQHGKNKQMRDTSHTPGGEELNALTFQVDRYVTQCAQSIQLYRDLLVHDWPRELARCVLPVSIYSEMFATLNLRNLLHFLELRMAPDAQPEIQVYARAMMQLAREVVPVTMGAFIEEMAAKGDRQ